MKLDLSKTNGSSPPAALVQYRPASGNTSVPDADGVVFITDEILTADQVAAWLKMTPRQVYELTRRRGQVRSEHPLPFIKIHAKCLRFRRSDVQRWLDTLARKARVQ
jgi:predicted DNA-binding transcriptional regulator AlpA